MAILDKFRKKKDDDFLELDKNPSGFGVPGPLSGQDDLYAAPSGVPGPAGMDPTAGFAQIAPPAAAPAQLAASANLAQKIDTLSAKVDALKMTVDALSQRLMNLERRSQPTQQQPAQQPQSSSYGNSSAGDFFGGNEPAPAREPQQEPGWHY